MIELQQRHSPIERRCPLVVIDTVQNKPEDIEWLVDNFGKDRFLRICEQIHESFGTNYVLNYLIVDVYHKDWDLV